MDTETIDPRPDGLPEILTKRSAPQTTRADLARDYLTRGVILGAGSLGVALSPEDVQGTLFSGDETGDGQQKLQALIQRKLADRRVDRRE